VFLKSVDTEPQKVLPPLRIRWAAHK